MNNVLILFIMLAVFLVPCRSYSAGEKYGWRSGDDIETKEWQDENGPSEERTTDYGGYEKWGRKNRQGRFVPQAREKELLDLLRQLDSPQGNEKQIGGKSEIQRKIFLIRKLRKFDDCRAEEALKKLSEEDWCEDRGGDDLVCGQWMAKEGMEEVKSAADLKKLNPKTGRDEEKKIITKYTTHPYINDFAARKIKQYLKEQAARDSEFYALLMVEKFPQDAHSEMLLRRYPELVPESLSFLLQSSDPADVWWGVNLARTMERPDFLQQSTEVAFQKKGRIDYSDTEQLKTIQAMVLGYCRDFENLAAPCYRAALYSDFPETRESVVNGIRRPDNPGLIRLFQEYYDYLRQHPSPANDGLAERIKKRIVLPEGSGQ